MEAYLDKYFWKDEEYLKLLELKSQIDYVIALLKAESEAEKNFYSSIKEVNK
jgi:hypothetical protein